MNKEQPYVFLQTGPKCTTIFLESYLFVSNSKVHRIYLNMVESMYLATESIYLSWNLFIATDSIYLSWNLFIATESIYVSWNLFIDHGVWESDTWLLDSWQDIPLLRNAEGFSGWRRTRSFHDTGRFCTVNNSRSEANWR